jgi:hypothetical protein
VLRQSVAILCLLIHLFNIGGYRLLFDTFEQRASYKLVTQLDNEEYTDDQLIEMKVPLPMPYQTNWSSFERYNGEIMIEGVHYNYVKRKVWNDTLILLCIPNHEKMKLNSAKEQFFSLVNDLDQKGEKTPDSKHGLIKSITSDFQIEENLFIVPQLALKKKQNIILDDALFIPQHVSVNEQPPELV